MGRAKPGETRGLMGTGPGSDHQEAAGRVFGRVWNRTKVFSQSKPGPLAGYPDTLLTLTAVNSRYESTWDFWPMAAGNRSYQGTPHSKRIVST